MGAPSPLLRSGTLSQRGHRSAEGRAGRGGSALHAPSSPCTDPTGKNWENAPPPGKINPDRVRKEAQGDGGKVSHSTGHSAARGGPQDVSCAGAALLCPGFTTHLELPAPHRYFGILSAPELGWRIGSSGRMGTALRLAWLFSLCPF